MAISEDMSGSMRSSEGVIDVIIASSRPATRCKSRLSFKSRSSKMAGLPSDSAQGWSLSWTYRIGIIYGKAATACTSDSSTSNQFKTAMS